MSTRELRAPPIMYMRNSRRRKAVLDVDLNVPPPSENHRDQEGTSARAGSLQDGQAGEQGGSAPPPPPPIDLEAVDDDVIISSPRAFAEAINNSRRTQERAVVVDVDSEVSSSRVIPNNRTKRRRLSPKAPRQTIINYDLYINLDGSSNSMRENAQSAAAPAPPPPPPPPKEPTFSCPVCMGPLVEEMSTKCGHIFCKACIKAAITAQNKCPTCRRKVTMKDTIRVYLPTTN
ncbi:hypothetical protein LguiA_011733 [Lonicera macranthoides]